jgi:shikimate kinase
MPGSGKSTMGRSLSRLVGMPFNDADLYIAGKMRKSIADIFRDEGEARFREIESAALLEMLAADKPTIIAAGGGMPCFGNNMDIMKVNGITVYLKSTPESLFNHLKNDRKRPLVRGKTEDELKQYINDTLNTRKSFYEKADITLQMHSEAHPSQFASHLWEMIKYFKLTNSDTKNQG